MNQAPEVRPEVSPATGFNRIEQSVTFRWRQRYRAKERGRSYDPIRIRAYAAKLAWFQEGD
jgi:hypothetical protein